MTAPPVFSYYMCISYMVRTSVCTNCTIKYPRVSAYTTFCSCVIRNI